MDTLYKEIQQKWEKKLKPYGVKLPRLKSQLGSALVILYENINQFVHIDDIKEKLKNDGHKLTGTDPVQVRHLSTQMGWQIEKEGKFKHKLITVEEPLSNFISAKRFSRLDKENWQLLLSEYNNQCVNCGSESGKPMRWDVTQKTVLQQGHMDPRKNLAYDNCIPQCSFCNQQYKNKAIFNKRGLVIDFCKSGF